MTDTLHAHKELRALDARLAAVVGYTEIRQSTGINGAWWGQPPDGWVSEWGLKIPYFTSDWGAAGLLADVLRADGWGIEVSTPIGGWSVAVRKTQDTALHGYGYAPTFAEALGRAIDDAYARRAAVAFLPDCPCACHTYQGTYPTSKVRPCWVCGHYEEHP